MQTVNRYRRNVNYVQSLLLQILYNLVASIDHQELDIKLGLFSDKERIICYRDWRAFAKYSYGMYR